MVPALVKFHPGPVRAETLNAELAKLLLNIIGDGQVIETSRSGQEVTVRLNIANLLALIPKSGASLLFAKLTSQDATNKWWYNWSEAQPTPTGWAVKSGGRTGATTGPSADPAMWTDESETTDLSGLPHPYVLLARAQPDSSGQSGWVIVSPIGVCTTADVPGYVHWDAVNNRFTQDKTSNTWTQGLLVHISSTTTVNITDTSAC